MTRRGSLLGTFFPPLVITLVAALVLVTGFAGRAMRQFLLDHTANELQDLALVLTDQFAEPVAAGDLAAVRDLCRRVGGLSQTRITVMLADGRVIADSEEDTDLMDNHGDRPEFIAALAGETGRSTRYSATLDHRRMYVAVAGGSPDARYVLRTSVPLASLGELMGGVYRQIALAGTVLMLLTVLTSFLLSRRLSRGLRQLQSGAEAYAAGDLDGRLVVADTTEIAGVAAAMNRMARQLAERFDTIEKQRNEREAVLSSMAEGVLAVDTGERVIGLNEAGGRLLGMDPAAAAGRSIQEVGRNSDLTALAREVLAGHKPIERDVRLGGSTGRWLQVHATGLIDQDQQPLGALLVLNDVTRLHRLETMRRDFVANVSHELKTPITSIKGFVETLLDAPPSDPAELERFLRIVNKQADRLDAIITDLLALSRLEEDTDTGGLATQRTSLEPVLAQILRNLSLVDPAGAGRVTLACESGMQALINPPLLEQAVGNLLDNALKYSPPEAAVTITCRRAGDKVAIAVADNGPGIAAEHLPRLFERFYRVDKARSRQLGGTGLGLAIVKHIAQAHGGGVEVASRIGTGSTFTLTILAEEQA